MSSASEQNSAAPLLFGTLIGVAATAGLVGVTALWLHRRPGGIGGWLSRAHLPAFIEVALGNDGTEAAAAFARARVRIAAARTAMAAGQSAAAEAAAAQVDLTGGEELREKVTGPSQLVAYLSDDANTTRTQMLALQRDMNNLLAVVWPRPPPGVPTR